MPNITIHLDDETHQLAKVFSAQSRTSLSQLFRDYIRSIAPPKQDNTKRAILERYSKLEMSSADAMNALGFTCLEELMAATVKHGFDLPRLNRKDALRLARQVITKPGAS